MSGIQTETTAERLGIAVICAVILGSAATLLAWGAFAWFRITEMMTCDGDSALGSAMEAAGL